MSVFRQDSLTEETNRESSTFTAVAGVALQFTTSTSSTSTSSTQTSSETVIQRMVGTGAHSSANGIGSIPSVSSPESLASSLYPALGPGQEWRPGGGIQQDDGYEGMAAFEGEMRRKDHIIEELIKLHPNHGLNKARGGGDVEEALRSDLAAMTVKVERTEQQIREAMASVSSKDARVVELTRQLDAHRQEHARQAATIVTLRQKLQEEESSTVSLRSNQRRGEFTIGALTRENRQYADRVSELENRLKTHMEEREAAEQRSESSNKRLLELIQMVTASLSLDDLDPHDAQEKLSSRLAELVQECARLRGQVNHTTESLQQQESEASAARQTVTRLVNELDDEKRMVDEQKQAILEYNKETDDLRTKLRAVEEEVKSVRERLHNTNKSYNSTLEELHSAEKQLQSAKDEAVVSDHRRQQCDAESRGILTTVAALLSSPENRIQPELESITDRIQSLVSTSREAAEHIERLTTQVTSLGEQSRRQSELYETAVKRGRQTEADYHSMTSRCRQLEADSAAAESARESLAIENEKINRVLSRVVEALRLSEMGNEVNNDIEMIICRCQQLAKLEGEKIVDKTTTVYQLQRKVKSLREAVDRKDLHVDMLRRKLALTEDAARASRHLEEERDELIAKYKRQCRVVERLNSEVSEMRLQVRDLQSQLTDAADDKSRSSQMQKKMEELTTKVNELDTIRSRQQKKITQLKEQVKTHGEQVLEERRLNESGLENLSQELAVTKQAVRDLTRREKQLIEFRRTVTDLMGAEGEPGAEGDYEAICRLERLVGAHRELTDLSRRMDEITAPSRPNSARTTLASRSPPLRSPSRPSSAALQPPHFRLDSPPRITMEQNFLDMSEELRALADDAHNHRPPPRLMRRPPSAHFHNHAPSPTHGHPHGHMMHHHPHARTPSPSKRPSTDEDD